MKTSKFKSLLKKKNIYIYILCPSVSKSSLSWLNFAMLSGVSSLIHQIIPFQIRTWNP